MSRVTELEKALTTLFRKGTEVGYTETEIDEFLENIDYHALLQAVWNKAETVYAYRADGKNALSLDYRSTELFKQRATLLYEDVGDSYIGAVFAARSMELWLLEDMGFAVVAKFSVNAGESEYVTEYRVYKGSDWADSEISLDLEDLVSELAALCDPYYEHEQPIYELWSGFPMRETIQNANGKQFHAVSLSGGKDSTAMLLLMIERDMPINMVLSADTGMEFPEMYEHLAKLDEHLFRERGIHITTLRHPKGFEYLMFDEPKQKPRSLENRAKLGIPPYGNGWPGIRVRWCTGQLKTHLITKEVNRLKGELGAIHYVGIAADEAWRCKDERYPLVEWGITEAQALQACYDRGFDFGGLYEIYHRASCWCCPFQRIDELRKLRKHHPELWEKLLELDRRALAQFGTGPLGQFKQNWSVKRLDTRFAEEDGQTG